MKVGDLVRHKSDLVKPTSPWYSYALGIVTSIRPMPLDYSGTDNSVIYVLMSNGDELVWGDSELEVME